LIFIKPSRQEIQESLLAFTHLLTGEIVRPIAKYGFRKKAIQVFEISPHTLDQGIAIHVVSEFGEEEADLSESLFRPLRLFSPKRGAAKANSQSQKNDREEKNKCFPFHITR
jgi:hypothetical protein